MAAPRHETSRGPSGAALDLLITNAVVLTLDGERRILDPGHVGVRGGVIATVGPGATPEPPLPALRTINAHGGVVHPGLIDAHAHVAWGLTRCFAPEHLSEDELFRRFDEPMLEQVSDEDEHIGTQLSCLEMAVNGTTCFADTGSAMRDLAPTVEAAEAIGVRGMVSCLNADSVEGVDWLSLPSERCLERIEEGLSRYPAGRGRVWACAGLVGMNTASDGLVQDAKALADTRGVPLNVHKSFSADEVDECRATLQGRDPLRGYADLEVLAPNTMLVHANLMTDAEVDLVAAAGSSVVHCPTASMMYAIGGSRLGRFPELVARGVPVALGTDATQWQNAWDLTRSIYLAATIHKEARGERPVITAEAALEMATLHGAQAIGRGSELGSLEAGKLADLVVHGVGRPEVHPALDAVGTLVFSGQARTVRMVVVGGEVVVEDGEPTRIDREALLARVDRAARDLSRRLGGLPEPRWPVVSR